MQFNKKNFNQEFPKNFEKELNQICRTLNYFGFLEVEKKIADLGEIMSPYASGSVIVFKNLELDLEIDLKYYIQEFRKEWCLELEEFDEINLSLTISKLNSNSFYFSLWRYFRNKNIPLPGCKVDENVIENVRSQLNLIQITLMQDLAPMLRGETFIDHSNESLQDYYDALSAAELNPEQEAIDDYLKNKRSMFQNFKEMIKKKFGKFF